MPASPASRFRPFAAAAIPFGPWPRAGGADHDSLQHPQPGGDDLVVAARCRLASTRGLLFGGALGLPFSIFLLMNAERAVYTSILGVFLLVYGIWMLLRRQMTVRWRHPALNVAVGFIGGITGGAPGFPGAAVTIWCGCKGWDKNRQRALFQPFILLMQVAALIMINVVRPAEAHGMGVAAGDLLYIPASLLGTTLGLTLFRWLSDTQFTRLVNVMLIVSGLSYII